MLTDLLQRKVSVRTRRSNKEMNKRIKVSDNDDGNNKISNSNEESDKENTPQENASQDQNLSAAKEKSL